MFRRKCTKGRDCGRAAVWVKGALGMGFLGGQRHGLEGRWAWGFWEGRGMG